LLSVIAPLPTWFAKKNKERHLNYFPVWKISAGYALRLAARKFFFLFFLVFIFEDFKSLVTYLGYSTRPIGPASSTI
jgi:hypothetical protein